MTALLPLLDGVVTGRTKGLPIRSVPEQALIATVRNDVVDDGSKAGDAVLAAFPAVRMRSQVFGAGLAPLMVVATSAGRRTARIVAGVAFAACVLLANTMLAVRNHIPATAKTGRLPHACLAILLRRAHKPLRSKAGS